MPVDEETWIELFVLGRNTWNHFAVYKQMNFGSFKKFTYKR